jgi:hypothetical protein
MGFGVCRLISAMIRSKSGAAREAMEREED